MSNSIIKGCGFHHIAYRTPDWDSAIGFWCDGLGFAPALTWGEAPHRAAMLDLGDGNYFELFERETSGVENAPESEANALHYMRARRRLRGGVAKRGRSGRSGNATRNGSRFRRQNRSVGQNRVRQRAGRHNSRIFPMRRVIISRDAHRRRRTSSQKLL